MISKSRVISIFFTLAALFAMMCHYGTDVRAQSDSVDAIAIRVIPNPGHYSAETWYRNQSFSGSPQAIVVDGYSGIRDGNTVYVNVANIIDQGTQKRNDDDFYSNIYLIAYNENASSPTVDIFSQILKHWKFNVNLEATGLCRSAASNACFLDSDCPLDDFCLGYKSRVIRDTERLESLATIGDALEKYKSAKGHYPSLNSGSYLPNKTVSAWPSWQKVFAQSLGINLPVDPINELGPLAGRFDSVTGWDEQKKEFASNLDDGNNPLPADSLAIVYRTDKEGRSAYYCAQLEVIYRNISDIYSCSPASVANTAPRIMGANLVGWPGVEFTGVVSAIDPDSDELSFSIEPVVPATVSGWTSENGWEWASGSSFFRLDKTNVFSQRRVYAAKSGLASLPGKYRVRITANDGRGASNSAVSEIFDVNVRSYAMDLNDIDDEIIIGTGNNYHISGADASQNIFNVALDFVSASFNGEAIATEEELNRHGFKFDGMDLKVSFDKINSPKQRTGNYVIRSSAQDPSTGAVEFSESTIVIVNHPPQANNLENLRIPVGRSLSINTFTSDPDGHSLVHSLSSVPALSGISMDADDRITGMPAPLIGTYEINFEARDAYYDYTISPYSAGISKQFRLEIYDNPPSLLNIKANYANNLVETCVMPAECAFTIDNGETATVQIGAVDNDPGHSARFELLTDFSSENGGLTIDPATGVISGLKNLNQKGLAEKNYSVQVKVHDGYCAGNPPASCSVTASFDLKVMPYCDINNTASARKAFSPGADIEVMSSGYRIPLGDTLSDCSAVGKSTADFLFSGAIRDLSLVFVLDLSSSMEAEVDGNKTGFDLMKESLVKPTDGILARLYTFSQSVKSLNVNVKIGLVGFNDSTPDYFPLTGLVNISNTGINSLVNEVNTYITGSETNTLEALNQAEKMFNLNENSEKIVVMMSDGIPGIDCENIVYGCQETWCGCGETCSSGTDRQLHCYFSGNQDDCCAPDTVFCQGLNATCCPEGDPDCCIPEKIYCYEIGKCPALGLIANDDCTYTDCSLSGKCGGCGTCETCPSNSCPSGQAFCNGACRSYTIPSCTCPGGEGSWNENPCSPACNTCPTCGGASCKSDSDFKIAITPQTQCLSESHVPEDCFAKPCPDNHWKYGSNCAGKTGCQQVVSGRACPAINCDISGDVTKQAAFLKGEKGVSIYSIYYNTGFQNPTQAKNYMCEWSSDPKADCYSDKYSYAGADINSLFLKVLEKIIGKPKNVYFGSIAVTDPAPLTLYSEVKNVNFDSLLSCGISDVFLPVDYSGSGKLLIKNLSFYYCPGKLHN